MRKRAFAALGVLALACLSTAQQPKPERSLKVKLNYTGAGKVDDAHKIIVFLFDTPDFTEGNAAPIGVQTATAKDQAITFSGITGSPVYIVAAFDPAGTYDGASGPPPSGASLGMPMTPDGKPSPIAVEAGKVTQMELAFGDNIKMP